MGTRHLTVVVMDGKYKVAQYGQWDGYPDGQGIRILRFLENEFVEHKFRTNLRKLKVAETEEEFNALDVLYQGKDHWPAEFDRDTGSEILKLIQDGKVESGFLVNHIRFAGCGDCEYVWLIDLDKRVFECYEGWNVEPLHYGDRFFFLGQPDREDGYYPAKFFKRWDLAELPTEQEFLDAFKTEEDEEDDA